MAISDKSLWWYLLIFVCIFAWVIVLGGCDDTTPPGFRFISSPEIRRMGPVGNEVHKLDAWQLGEAGYPSMAAFGWEVRFYYETGDIFDEPGVHIRLAAGQYDVPCGPVLEKFLTGTGLDSEGGEDVVTVVSGGGEVTRLYVGVRDWPPGEFFANEMPVTIQVIGTNSIVETDVSFVQDVNSSFFAYNGGYHLSRQGDLYPTMNSQAMSQASSDPNTSSDPNIPMDLGPTSPTPKVLVADIQPVLAECALSVDYPPYSDPNTGGEGILVRSRWMKAGVIDGGWVLSPAPFITLLPYDSNDVTSIAETAWPYTISYHAPAESAGLGAIEAKLSIVDPNGAPCYTVDIQVHEVGQCATCDDWVWRSDYIVPLTGPGVGFIRVQAPFGDTVGAWLPPGHKFKIEPKVNARTLLILAWYYWLAQSDPLGPLHPLDLNDDGIVNFTDYSILLRMK